MEPTIKKQENAKEAVKAKTNAAKGLRDLFEVGLKDLYYAEKALSQNLPKMVKNASSPELVSALKDQINETEQQVYRLEKIFEVTGIKPVAKKCEAIEGIINEGNSLIESTKIGDVRDAGIISTGQKAKHYEIASYGTLHAYAKTLGESKAADMLAMTLHEEKKIDASLTDIAVSNINSHAAAAASSFKS